MLERHRAHRHQGAEINLIAQEGQEVTLRGQALTQGGSKDWQVNARLVLKMCDGLLEIIDDGADTLERLGGIRRIIKEALGEHLV